MPRLRTLEEVAAITDSARQRFVADDSDHATILFLGCMRSLAQHRRSGLLLNCAIPNRSMPESFNVVDWDARLPPEHGALLDRVIADNDMG
jgi:hypothetical protein